MGTQAHVTLDRRAKEVIGGLVSNSELHDAQPEDAKLVPAPDKESLIYLVANGHPQDGSPYASRSAWNVMRRGWRR